MCVGASCERGDLEQGVGLVIKRNLGSIAGHTGRDDITGVRVVVVVLWRRACVMACCDAVVVHRFLDLGSNMFTGVIPTTLCNAVSLE